MLISRDSLNTHITYITHKIKLSFEGNKTCFYIFFAMYKKYKLLLSKTQRTTTNTRTRKTSRPFCSRKNTKDEKGP